MPRRRDESPEATAKRVLDTGRWISTQELVLLIFAERRRAVQKVRAFVGGSIANDITEAILARPQPTRRGR